MALLEKEKFISSRSLRVRGSMLLIHRGLIDAAAREQEDPSLFPAVSSVGPVASRKVELTAMDVVTTADRRLVNEPTDLSMQNIGYDIASYYPEVRLYRFIEIKGSANDGFAGEPRYARDALHEREPRFDQDAIQFDLKRLLERAEVPN